MPIENKLRRFDKKYNSPDLFWWEKTLKIFGSVLRQLGIKIFWTDAEIFV